MKSNTPHPARPTPWLSLLVTSAVLGLMFATTACASKKPQPRPLAIRIQAAGEAATIDITVHLVAANSLYEKSYIEDPVDPLLRRFSTLGTSDELKSFKLTSRPMLISKKDPVWTIWRDRQRADTLVIIADLPKNFGGADPEQRRVRIPLDKNEWKNLKEDTVIVEIRPNQVKVLTPPGK